MKKLLFLLALLPFLFFSAKTDRVATKPNGDALQTLLQQEVSNQRSKSIIVGISDAQGRQIFRAGSIEDGKLVLPDGNTVYEIGSIGKLFTSLLMAEMSLKKEINVNDPISKYLPQTVTTPTRNGKEISLLNLSSHRAGFPRMPYNINQKSIDNPYSDYSEADLYTYLSNFQLTRDIDSKWQYSNTGYGLLGHLLSRAAKKDYASLIQKRICAPLGMNSTQLVSTKKAKRNSAVGHGESGNTVPPTVGSPVMYGAGFFSSTVNDLLTFAEANLNLKTTSLSAAMQLTHQPQGKKDGNDGFITMGWTLLNDDGQEILWKDGGTPGFRSFMGIDKKNKIAIVILSNSDNPVTDIGLHLLDSTYELKPYHYKWKLVDTLNATIQTSGVTAGMDLYHQLKASPKPDLLFDEKQLLYVGNALQRAQQMHEAIEIYKLNVEEYPNAPPVYESLAEAYKRNGNKELAITYFEKLMAMDAGNPHWEWMVKVLKEKK